MSESFAEWIAKLRDKGDQVAIDYYPEETYPDWPSEMYDLERCGSLELPKDQKRILKSLRKRYRRHLRWPERTSKRILRKEYHRRIKHLDFDGADKVCNRFKRFSNIVS